MHDEAQHPLKSLNDLSLVVMLEVPHGAFLSGQA
jgi:hypothetical protein